MPARDGCHLPESGGTKRPISGYQAPVDNLANPLASALGKTWPNFPIVLLRGVPNARTGQIYPAEVCSMSLGDAGGGARCPNTGCSLAHQRPEGVPSARMLFLDGFDLLGDLRHRRFGR